MKDPWDPEIRYKVLRDADLYVLTYPRILVRKHRLKRPALKPFAYKRHFQAVATYEEQSLPPELKGWVYDYVHLADEDVAVHFTDYTISDEGLSLLPDIAATQTATIITETVRDFLSQEDPGGCQFVPVKVSGKTSGREASEPRFAVLPRRFFLYEGNSYEHIKPRDIVVEYGNDQGRAALEQMKAAQLFVAQLPIFSGQINPKNPIFNRTTFRKMKERGFTGLVEFKTEKYLGNRDYWECVGHVRFS